MLKTATMAAAIFIGSSPAWGVNKCTGADGKIVFQDAACGAGSAKAEFVRSDPAVSAIAKETWVFRKNRDEMTGDRSCAAYSPELKFRGRTYSENDSAQVVIMATKDNKFLAAVRLVSGQRIFHNDMAGTGLKTEPGSFHATPFKLGQKSAAFFSNANAIDSMLLAKSIRLRVRFWPYDTLADSDPVSTVGLPQAVSLAADCAKSL